MKLLFGYKNLIAWQRADELAHLVYQITILFPRDELFGLTSQLRRAALSVPTNIVLTFQNINIKNFQKLIRLLNQSNQVPTL